MRVDRQMEFARIQGALSRFQIPHTDPVWDTFKEIQTSVGNMTSDQLALIERLIEQVVAARNRIAKEKLSAAINAVEL